MDFLLENISFQLKVDILEYFLRLVQHWESWNLENLRVLPVLTMFEEQGTTKGRRQKTDILRSGWLQGGGVSPHGPDRSQIWKIGPTKKGFGTKTHLFFSHTE